MRNILQADKQLSTNSLMSVCTLKFCQPWRTWHTERKKKRKKERKKEIKKERKKERKTTPRR